MKFIGGSLFWSSVIAHVVACKAAQCAYKIGDFILEVDAEFTRRMSG